MQHAGSLVALSGFSCPEACGILVPNRGSTCIWCIGRQIVTPPDYQGSPSAVFFVRTLFGKENSSFIKLSLWSSQRLSVSKRFIKCQYILDILPRCFHLSVLMLSICKKILGKRGKSHTAINNNKMELEFILVSLQVMSFYV